MLNSILVPLDGSPIAECVLPHVNAIAQIYSASVELIRVLEPIHGDTRPSADPLNWQINRTEADLYLNNLVDRLHGMGLTTRKVLLEGSVVERIVEFAQNQDTSLILLCDHGQSGLCPGGISSVTQKVAFTAPTSIMIVRATDPVKTELQNGHYEHILVPLDGSWRAESVLPLVISLARAHNSKIHLAHVISKPEMARRTPLTPEDVELSSHIVDRNREEASHYLEQTRSRLLAQDLESETHLLTGEASGVPALHDLIDQTHTDLVIMNAHGYTGDPRWPYGSLVQNFILYGTTPLLIVQDFPNKFQLAQSEVAVREHPGR